MACPFQYFNGIVPKDQNYRNLVVNDKLVSCDHHATLLKVNKKFTIPIVGNVAFQIVQPQGSLVYDQHTDSIWYSNGIAWIPINAALSGIILDSITVYVNAGTGNDMNDGLTSSTAVATIQRGINILGTFLAQQGILQLEGPTAFNIGSNVDINFFPATSFIGNIIVRGTKVNTINDSVAGISYTIGPQNTWTQITGVNGNYPVSAYTQKFIENDTQHRTYVVLDNSVGTVDTITGIEAPNGFNDGWIIGDNFTLFDIESTITFAGDINILNPSNVNIIFEYVYLLPSSGSSWKNPVLPITDYRGCRMDANSDRSYTGSMNLFGCYSENLVTSTTFAPSQKGSCRKCDSVWLNGPSINFDDTCSALFFYSSNCQHPRVVMNIETANFSGYSIQILNQLSTRSIEMGAGSIYSLFFIRVETISTTGSLVPDNNRCLSLSNGSYGILHSATLIQNSTVVGNPHQVLTVGFNAQLFIGQPSVPIGYGDTSVLLRITSPGNAPCIFTFAGSIISCFMGNDTFTAENTGSSTFTLVTLNNNSSFNTGFGGSYIFNGGNGTVFNIANGSSINLGAGGNLSMTSNTAASVINITQSSTAVIVNNAFVLTNTNADGSGVTCNRGSKFNLVSSNTLWSNTNQVSLTKASVVLGNGSTSSISSPINDPTASRLVICGTITVAGPGPYSTSINDYASAPTKNCAITFG